MAQNMHNPRPARLAERAAQSGDTMLILHWPDVDGPDGPAFYFGPLWAKDANRRAEELAARSDHPAVSVEKLHWPHRIPIRTR